MASIEQQQNNARLHLVLLKDFNPMSRNVDCEVIVLQKEGETVLTRDGTQIHKFWVADKTASIYFQMWGEAGDCIKSGDILRLSGVDSKQRKGQLMIMTSKSSKVRRIGQDTFPFVEKPNMSETPVNPPKFFKQNNNRSRNESQQQGGRIPNNNRRGGYQGNGAHPYNSRIRPHHLRNNNGYSNNNNNRGGRGKYQQDLDNIN